MGENRSSQGAPLEVAPEVGVDLGVDPWSGPFLGKCAVCSLKIAVRSPKIAI